MRRRDGRHAKDCASSSHGRRGNPVLDRGLQQERGAAASRPAEPVSGVSAAAAAARLPGNRAATVPAAAVSAARRPLHLSSAATVPGGHGCARSGRATWHGPAVCDRVSLSDRRPVPFTPLQHAGGQMFLALPVERRLSTWVPVRDASVRAHIATTMTSRPGRPRAWAFPACNPAVGKA
jgi:hypothetical protein